MKSDLQNTSFAINFRHIHSRTRQKSQTHVYTTTEYSNHTAWVKADDKPSESNENKYKYKSETKIYCPSCQKEVPTKFYQEKYILFTYDKRAIVKKKLFRALLIRDLQFPLILWGLLFVVIAFIFNSKFFVDNSFSDLAYCFLAISFVTILILYYFVVKIYYFNSLNKNPMAIVNNKVVKKFLSDIGEYEEFQIIKSVDFGDGVHSFYNFSEKKKSDYSVDLPEFWKEKFNLSLMDTD